MMMEENKIGNNLITLDVIDTETKVFGGGKNVKMSIPGMKKTARKSTVFGRPEVVDLIDCYENTQLLGEGPENRTWEDHNIYDQGGGSNYDTMRGYGRGHYQNGRGHVRGRGGGSGRGQFHKTNDSKQYSREDGLQEIKKYMYRRENSGPYYRSSRSPQTPPDYINSRSPPNNINSRSSPYHPRDSSPQRYSKSRSPSDSRYNQRSRGGRIHGRVFDVRRKPDQRNWHRGSHSPHRRRERSRSPPRNMDRRSPDNNSPNTKIKSVCSTVDPDRRENNNERDNREKEWRTYERRENDHHRENGRKQNEQRTNDRREDKNRESRQSENDSRENDELENGRLDTRQSRQSDKRKFDDYSESERKSSPRTPGRLHSRENLDKKKQRTDSPYKWVIPDIHRRETEQNEEEELEGGEVIENTRNEYNGSLTRHDRDNVDTRRYRNGNNCSREKENCNSKEKKTSDARGKINYFQNTKQIATKKHQKKGQEEKLVSNYKECVKENKELAEVNNNSSDIDETNGNKTIVTEVVNSSTESISSEPEKPPITETIPIEIESVICSNSKNIPIVEKNTIENQDENCSKSRKTSNIETVPIKNQNDNCDKSSEVKTDKALCTEIQTDADSSNVYNQVALNMKMIQSKIPNESMKSFCKIIEKDSEQKIKEKKNSSEKGEYKSELSTQYCVKEQDQVDLEVTNSAQPVLNDSNNVSKVKSDQEICKEPPSVTSPPLTDAILDEEILSDCFKYLENNLANSTEKHTKRVSANTISHHNESSNKEARKRTNKDSSVKPERGKDSNETYYIQVDLEKKSKESSSKSVDKHSERHSKSTTPKINKVEEHKTSSENVMRSLNFSSYKSISTDPNKSDSSKVSEKVIDNKSSTKRHSLGECEFIPLGSKFVSAVANRRTSLNEESTRRSRTPSGNISSDRSRTPSGNKSSSRSRTPSGNELFPRARTLSGDKKPEPKRSVNELASLFQINSQNVENKLPVDKEKQKTENNDKDKVGKEETVTSTSIEKTLFKKNAQRVSHFSKPVGTMSSSSVHSSKSQSSNKLQVFSNKTPKRTISPYRKNSVFGKKSYHSPKKVLKTSGKTPKSAIRNLTHFKSTSTTHEQKQLSPSSHKISEKEKQQEGSKRGNVFDINFDEHLPENKRPKISVDKSESDKSVKSDKEKKLVDKDQHTLKKKDQTEMKNIIKKTLEKSKVEETKLKIHQDTTKSQKKESTDCETKQLEKKEKSCESKSKPISLNNKTEKDNSKRHSTELKPRPVTASIESLSATSRKSLDSVIISKDISGNETKPSDKTALKINDSKRKSMDKAKESPIMKSKSADKTLKLDNLQSKKEIDAEENNSEVSIDKSKFRSTEKSNIASKNINSNRESTDHKAKESSTTKSKSEDKAKSKKERESGEKKSDGSKLKSIEKSYLKSQSVNSRKESLESKSIKKHDVKIIDTTSTKNSLKEYKNNSVEKTDVSKTKKFDPKKDFMEDDKVSKSHSSIIKENVKSAPVHTKSNKKDDKKRRESTDIIPIDKPIIDNSESKNENVDLDNKPKKEEKGEVNLNVLKSKKFIDSNNKTKPDSLKKQEFDSKSKSDVQTKKCNKTQIDKTIECLTADSNMKPADKNVKWNIPQSIEKVNLPNLIEMESENGLISETNETPKKKLFNVNSIEISEKESETNKVADKNTEHSIIKSATHSNMPFVSQPVRKRIFKKTERGRSVSGPCKINTVLEIDNSLSKQKNIETDIVSKQIEDLPSSKEVNKEKANAESDVTNEQTNNIDQDSQDGMYYQNIIENMLNEDTEETLEVNSPAPRVHNMLANEITNDKDQDNVVDSMDEDDDDMMPIEIFGTDYPMTPAPPTPMECIIEDDENDNVEETTVAKVNESHLEKYMESKSSVYNTCVKYCDDRLLFNQAKVTSVENDNEKEIVKETQNCENKATEIENEKVKVTQNSEKKATKIEKENAKETQNSENKAIEIAKENVKETQNSKNKATEIENEMGKETHKSENKATEIEKENLEDTRNSENKAAEIEKKIVKEKQNSENKATIFLEKIDLSLSSTPKKEKKTPLKERTPQKFGKKLAETFKRLSDENNSDIQPDLTPKKKHKAKYSKPEIISSKDWLKKVHKTSIKIPTRDIKQGIETRVKSYTESGNTVESNVEKPTTSSETACTSYIEPVERTDEVTVNCNKETAADDNVKTAEINENKTVEPELETEDINENEMVVEQENIDNDNGNFSDDEVSWEVKLPDVEMMSNNIYKTGFDVQHTKVLTDGSIVLTYARLDPKRLYRNVQCLLCMVCTNYFTPLAFTAHHDTERVVSLIDPAKSSKNQYKPNEANLIFWNTTAATIFQNFVDHFKAEFSKKNDGSPMRKQRLDPVIAEQIASDEHLDQLDEDAKKQAMAEKEALEQQRALEKQQKETLELQKELEHYQAVIEKQALEEKQRQALEKQRRETLVKMQKELEHHKALQEKEALEENRRQALEKQRRETHKQQKALEQKQLQALAYQKSLERKQKRDDAVVQQLIQQHTSLGPHQQQYHKNSSCQQQGNFNQVTSYPQQDLPQQPQPLYTAQPQYTQQPFNAPQQQQTIQPPQHQPFNHQQQQTIQPPQHHPFNPQRQPPQHQPFNPPQQQPPQSLHFNTLQPQQQQQQQHLNKTTWQNEQYQDRQQQNAQRQQQFQPQQQSKLQHQQQSPIQQQPQYSQQQEQFQPQQQIQPQSKPQHQLPSQQQLPVSQLQTNYAPSVSPEVPESRHVRIPTDDAKVVVPTEMYNPLTLPGYIKPIFPPVATGSLPMPNPRPLHVDTSSSLNTAIPEVIMISPSIGIVTSPNSDIQQPPASPQNTIPSTKDLQQSLVAALLQAELPGVCEPVKSGTSPVKSSLIVQSPEQPRPSTSQQAPLAPSVDKKKTADVERKIMRFMCQGRKINSGNETLNNLMLIEMLKMEQLEKLDGECAKQKVREQEEEICQLRESLKHVTSKLKEKEAMKQRLNLK